MIKKNWYAVLPSAQLGRTPVKTTVHDTDFVLLRGADGLPHAFSAYCPHRGCDLSRGTVEHNHLVCPFHGWRFDPTGRCTHIPANRANAPIPKSAQLTAYPACDAIGLIWVYTQPEQTHQMTPTLELFPEFQTVLWRRVPFEMSWHASFCRVVESVLDISHLPFVHPETTGKDVSPVVDHLDYAVQHTGIVIHPKPFAPTHPMEPVPAPPGVAEQTEIELLFPNRWIIRTPMGNENWMCTFLTFTPTTQETTHVFGVVMRNFQLDSEFLDDFHLEHTFFVLNEDKEIIECLRPMRAPDLKSESHVASDGPTIRFRSMLFDAIRIENTGG